MSDAAPLFPGVVFRHAVSLGADCEPAHQLRRLGRLSVRGLFDWLVTPLSSIPEVLADAGARLGVDFTSVNEGTSVRCNAYDLLYHHEFPRDDRGRVRFSADAIERCRSKMAHKLQSLLDGCAPPGPVLFVRMGPETDLQWDETGAGKRPVAGRDLNLLASALGWRLSGLDFRILVLVVNEDGATSDLAGLDSRIRVERVTRRRDLGWKLDDGDWDALFSRLSFTEAAASQLSELGETLFDSGEANFAPAATGAAAVALQEHAEHGRELWRRGDAFQAAQVFTEVYDAGLRDRPFVRDYIDLLTGEARYPEVLQRLAEMEAGGPALGFRGLLARAHAKLAVQRDRSVQIARAAEREIGDAWLDCPTLLRRLRAACRTGQPFSFVRLGDGEARFLLSQEPLLRPGLTEAEASSLGELVWSNWFGDSLAGQARADVADLFDAYRAAIRDADVLGVTDAARMGRDTAHFGYLAAQEDWLRAEREGAGGDQCMTSALNHHALGRLSPLLVDLLSGQPFLGVVGPHPSLAQQLARHFAISRHASYDLPSEGRLPTAEATRQGVKHFPDRYLQIVDSLSVPFPGAVFLVAAGLLGKVYCQRIKQLGGIALDIGSLADAWMGFDTRNGQMADIGRLGPDTPPATTVGCLSLAKTSSTALTTAIREAGFPDAIHLHYLGPLALSLKPQEPMRDLAVQISERIQDPAHTLRVVSSVRDPVARIISQAFDRAAIVGGDSELQTIETNESLMAWWDQTPLAKRDYWADWFDDTFLTTFGFDFRDHPFDHARKSIRFVSTGLKLVVVRQEDDASFKLSELRWLLGTPDITLGMVNETGRKFNAAAYRTFVQRFRASGAWLRALYETPVIRHFYTEEERRRAIQRWSGAEATLGYDTGG